LQVGSIPFGCGTNNLLNKSQTKEGNLLMRSAKFFDSHNSPEALEPKLSPSSSLGAVLAAPVVSTMQASDSDDDDSSLNNVPTNIPVTGYTPLIEYPPLPPSGPAGPGY
jgi:hypothetical protein